MNTQVNIRMLLAAVLVAAGFVYGSVEMCAGSVNAAVIQQPAPGTCCDVVSDCNPGWECKDRKGATCSPYGKPGYCERVNTGGTVVPVGPAT